MWRAATLRICSVSNQFNQIKQRKQKPPQIGGSDVRCQFPNQPKDLPPLYPSQSTIPTTTMYESPPPPVITLQTQGKPLSAATLQNPQTPIPILPTKPQIPIPSPPMLHFGDIIADWQPVAQPYIEQAPLNQRVALLYTLLETTLWQHVHAHTTTLEASIAAINFVFQITFWGPSRRFLLPEATGRGANVCILLDAHPPGGTCLPSRWSPGARV